MRVFTIAETAKELRVHEATVRRLIRARRIPHRKIGKLYFITEQDIADFYSLSAVPVIPVIAEGEKSDGYQ